jgi:hypothetical protein
MNAHVRRVLAIALAGLIVPAAVWGLRAQAPDEPVTYYGVTFPAEIGGARRISVRDYEPTNPGLGFSAGYRHRGATSTVYIYDLKLAAIPDDLDAAVVTRQFEQARSDIRRGQSADTTVEDKASFTILDGGRRPRLLCQGFVISKPDAGPVDSFLCLGVVNGKFFKTRTSMPQRRDSEPEAREFIEAWAGRLWGAP